MGGDRTGGLGGLAPVRTSFGRREARVRFRQQTVLDA
jgi:hypothetical protein